MIDVANGAHVDMGLGALKLRFRHPPTPFVQELGLTQRLHLKIRIVPLLAWLYTLHEPRTHTEPTIGFEPMTSSLPRKCSAS